MNNNGETFLSQQENFASMEFNTKNALPEICPICDNTYDLFVFAEHVYECIKKQDAEEKRDLEKMSERLALKIASEQVPNLNNTDAIVEQQKLLLQNITSQRPAKPICPQGLQCRHVEARHYIQFQVCLYIK